MIRSVVLGLFIPLANAIAQSAPVQLTITSTNQFRIVRSTRDSVLPPIFGIGRLQLAGDTVVVRDANAIESLEIASVDTLSPVHVEATQGGRVIASGDGPYVLIRQEADAISIATRSRAPTAVLRALRKP